MGPDLFTRLRSEFIVSRYLPKATISSRHLTASRLPVRAWRVVMSPSRLTCPTGQATIVGDSWRESHGGSARDDPYNVSS